MKSIRFYSFFIMAMLTGGVSSFAQTSAFTYQGRLNINGSPANGSYDLEFSLFTTNVTGVAVAGPVINGSTSISNGLFTTSIDFGAATALNPDGWLEISIRTNGAGSFVTLSPRQQLSPTPYALSAGSLAGVTSLNIIANNLNATVSGGSNNQATGYSATIAGGTYNSASDEYASVGGGGFNKAGGYVSTVSGGGNNVALGFGPTVGGGQNNYSTNDYATVGGGLMNVASGVYSVVPGGGYNQALGFAGFAAGETARALHDYCFVWNDSNVAYSSTGANQFRVHSSGGIFLDGNLTLGGTVTANGGVTFATDMHMGVSSADYRHFSIGGGNSYGYLYGSYPALGDGIHFGYNFYYDTAGSGHVINGGGATSRVSTGYGTIELATGGVNTAPLMRVLVTSTRVYVTNATFFNLSDRNVKQDFTTVSPAQILDKVAQLPVSEWSYTFDPSVRHLGPMAQDFYSAFNLGVDDKHIAPIDEEGIALAAIKGLNQKLEERDATIQKLTERIEKLEKVINRR